MIYVVVTTARHDLRILPPYAHTNTQTWCFRHCTIALLDKLNVIDREHFRAVFFCPGIFATSSVMNVQVLTRSWKRYTVDRGCPQLGKTKLVSRD